MTGDIASTLAGGLLTGGIYALVAVGLTLVSDVTRQVNVAQGSQMVLAMLLAWKLASRFGIDPYASLPLTTLLMFGAGYLVQRGLLGPATGCAPGRQMGRQPGHQLGEHRGTVLSLGLAAVLQGVATLLFGDDARVVLLPYSDAQIAVGPLLLGVPRLVGCAVSLGLGGLLWLFLAQTDSGRTIRAVAWEPEAARLVGIRPERSRALACGIGTACLGAAACLLLPGLPVRPQQGPGLLLVGLAASLPGGLGGYAGAVLGGLAAGAAESLAGLFLGSGLGGVGVGLVLLARLCAPMLRRAA